MTDTRNASAQRKPLRVFIAADSDDACARIARTLSCADDITVSGFAQSMREIENASQNFEGLDVLITDVLIEKRDMAPVIARLKQRLRDLDVLVYTSYSQEPFVIRAILAGYTLPGGYTAELAGGYTEMMENFSDLGLALIVSVGLVYFVLASQFESFVMPVIIMMILPIAFAGALFALPLTGKDLSMISLVSLIMLAGTVVNASIVLVDYIKQRRDRGETREEAILHACPLRIRPVLMTTLTTILALVPTALGMTGKMNEMMSDMGTTMIAGMLVSTVITLLFTPVYYCVIDDLTHRRERRKAKKLAAAQSKP